MADAHHAVMVHIRLSDDDLGTDDDDTFVERIENSIRLALDRLPRVGHWDGHEFGGGWAVIFCYGQDVFSLESRVTEALLPLDIDRGFHVVARSQHDEHLAMRSAPMWVRDH